MNPVRPVRRGAVSEDNSEEENAPKVYDGKILAEFTKKWMGKYERGEQIKRPDGTYDTSEVRPVKLTNPIQQGLKNATRYDCSGWLGYCLHNTYPELYSHICEYCKTGSINWPPRADDFRDYAEKHGGIRNDKNYPPKVGDLAFWGKHIEIIISVDGEMFRTSGSSGNRGTPIPKEKQFKNSYNDAQLTKYGNGTFWGFWTPQLPENKESKH